MDSDSENFWEIWQEYISSNLVEGGKSTVSKHLTRVDPDLTACQHFDAVVVATGRFNAPNMPHIWGLSEWENQYPEQISHSREHRIPEPYTNKTVLVVGAGVSTIESY